MIPTGAAANIHHALARHRRNAVEYPFQPVVSMLTEALVLRANPQPLRGAVLPAKIRRLDRSPHTC
jgi:hypothetical protein